MQKLKNTLLPHIGNISIGVGILALFTHLLHVVFFKKPEDAMWLFVFYPVQVEDYISMFLFKGSIGSKIPSLTLILFSVMLIAGGLLYKKTAGQDGRLLRFCYSVVAVNKGIIFLIIPLSFLFFKKINAQSDSSSIQQLPDFKIFLFFMIFALGTSILAFLITQWLIAEQKMRVYPETGEDGNEEFVFYPISRRKRLAHWFFDTVFALLIVSPVVFQVYNLLGSTNRYLSLQSFGDYRLMSVMFLLIMSLYYLLFEGLFNATPAKFITGSRVLDAYNLQKPTFGSILLRTLGRRIPFDSFSFFGKRGWHDSISGTTVVEEENFGQKRGYHAVWGILFIGIYVGGFAWVKLGEEYLDRQESALYTEAREYSKKAEIAAMQPGDVLHGALATYKSDAPDLLLIIDKIVGDSLFCTVNIMKKAYGIDRQNVHKYIPSAQYAGDVTLSKSKVATFHEQQKNYSFDFDQETYQLKAFLPLHVVEISQGSSRYSTTDGRKSGEFGFRFTGPPLEILNGKVTSGNVELKSSFPIKSYFYSAENQQGSFSLSLENLGKTNKYTIELTIAIEGREQIYLVKGIGSSLVVCPKP